MIFIYHVTKTVVGNQQTDGGIFHHEVQSLLRIARIEGLIAHTGLDGGQRQDDGLLVSGQDDGCHLFLQVGLSGYLTANLVNLRCQTVGKLIQLLVGISLVLEDGCGLVRMFGDHLLEACGHRVCHVVVQVPRLVEAVENSPLLLVGQADFRHVIEGDQSMSGILDTLGQSGHHLITVHR